MILWVNMEKHGQGQQKTGKEDEEEGDEEEDEEEEEEENGESRRRRHTFKSEEKHILDMRKSTFRH